jgi:hypothetical protein
MRIRILKQTSINGQPARVGQLLEPSDADARTLLAMGKAEPVPTDPDPVVITPEAAAPRPRKPRPLT